MMNCTLESVHHSEGSEKPPVKDSLEVYNMRLCPYAERTILVLLHKKLPFTCTNINLKKKPSWFLESTLGKVPVLLTEGKVIPESLLTCDYLDDVYGDEKLHPTAPLQKVIDRVLVEKQSQMMAHLYPLYGKFPGREFSNEEKLEKFQSLLIVLGGLEDELKLRGSSFLGGSKPCMADYMIFPFYERIEALPLMLPDLGTAVALPDNLSLVKQWIKSMRGTEPVKLYGMSPARMAKATKISHETADYDRAIKESAGL